MHDCDRFPSSFSPYRELHLISMRVHELSLKRWTRPNPPRHTSNTDPQLCDTLWGPTTFGVRTTECNLCNYNGVPH